MSGRMVSATEFKAKRLAILDEIEQNGGPIKITRRGRPVAILGPAKKKAWQSSQDRLQGEPESSVLSLTSTCRVSGM